jgi:hypothetical protein
MVGNWALDVPQSSEPLSRSSVSGRIVLAEEDVLADEPDEAQILGLVVTIRGWAIMGGDGGQIPESSTRYYQSEKL